MDNSNLYKELKYHLNYIQDKLDREVLFITVKGITASGIESFAITLPKNKDELLLTKNDLSFNIFTYDFNIVTSMVDLRDVQELNNACNGNLSQIYLDNEVRIYNKNLKFLLEDYFEDINCSDYDILHQYVVRIIKKYLSTDIEKFQESSLEEIINSYDNVYITSDLHLKHKKILLREPTRRSLVSTTAFDYISSRINKDPNKNKIDFNNLYDKYQNLWLENSSLEQDISLIDNYNSVVNKNDLCIILGDLCFGNGEDTNKILAQLNGDKILIVGNHDNYLNDKKFKKDLFIDIKDYLEFKYKNQNVVLCHYPILHFKRQEYEDGFVHLFGHTHTAKIHTPYHSYNVGVDVNDYKPIQLEKAIEYAKQERINKTRYNNEGLKDGIFS